MWDNSGPAMAVSSILYIISQTWPIHTDQTGFSPDQINFAVDKKLGETKIVYLGEVQETR